MRISTNQIYQRALTNMLSQQAKASKLQELLASGIRVQTPGDDPIAATQIELMSQRIGATELLQKNRQDAVSSLSLQEGVLGETVSTMHRLREIQVQAGDMALSASDRKSLATEAQGLLAQLKDSANTKDTNGNFMFSGGQSRTQPFSINAAGSYVYNGDSTQRFQAVSGSLKLAVNDTGDNIFMRIPNGNGRFTINTTATPNTGTAMLTTGSVTNEAAYVADNYTMNFTTNSTGQLVVMVSGLASGNVSPPSGLADDAQVYQAGTAISFNGMEITVDGEPQAGDSFAIAPSQNESLFSTVQRMIVNLNKPFTTSVEKAATQTENNQLLTQLDAAQNNILAFQSDIGSRLNQLEAAEKANNNTIDLSKESLGALRDADPVAVATQYNLQLVNLQAAQQSFVRIQSLSLFNYI